MSKVKTNNEKSRLFVAELKRENRKLQAQAVKLQVANLSLKGRITALEKEVKKLSLKTDLEAIIAASNKV